MLPSLYRIRRSKDFEEVFKRGKSFSNEYYLIKVRENGREFSRFAFSLPVKLFRKATERNERKRKLREVVRTLFPDIKEGYDVIFVAKEGIKEKDYWKIKKSVTEILEKARLMKK